MSPAGFRLTDQRPFGVPKTVVLGTCSRNMLLLAVVACQGIRGSTRLSAITVDHSLSGMLVDQGLATLLALENPAQRLNLLDWPAPLTPIQQQQGIRSLISLRLVPGLDSNLT